MLKYGDTVTVRLSDTSEIDADIKNIVEQENGDVMIIFRTNKAVEDLISYRKISIDVSWWSYSGLRVPNSTIVEEGGLYYVIRNRTGYKDKIYIKVLKRNNNYSIIENYTTQDWVDLGYTLEESYSKRSISMYDEVICEPLK